jgi:ribonuclease HII
VTERQAHRRRYARLRAFDRRFDRDAWAAGRLVGVDEAGVGPLAGPVVAAAVILPADFECPELFDSKQMPAGARRRCEVAVRAAALGLGVARVSPARIDRINILRAMLAAHRRALARLPFVPRAVLVDGKRAPRLPAGWEAVRVETVVGGDARSLAVAAASVIAKETRDRIMRRLDRRFPEYGFARHKGYASRDHRNALLRLGMSPVHRRTFCGFLEIARQGSLSFEVETPSR